MNDQDDEANGGGDGVDDRPGSNVIGLYNQGAQEQLQQEINQPPDHNLPVLNQNEPEPDPIIQEIPVPLLPNVPDILDQDPDEWPQIAEVPPELPLLPEQPNPAM